MSQTSNSTRSTSFHSAQQSRSYGALSDAFSKAWEQLSNKEKGLFSPKSGASAPAGATAAAGIGITDIWSQIESKQEEFSKSKKQIFLRRLQPYIDGLNRYSQTINVFTQAKPELLALIWGPVRLLLQLLTDYSETWSHILDALEDFGNDLPQFQEAEEATERSEQLHKYLVLVYKEILDFHMILVKVYRHTGFMELFSLKWIRYKDSIGAVRKNLQKYKHSIETQLSLILLKDSSAQLRKLDEMHDEFLQFREKNMADQAILLENAHNEKLDRLMRLIQPYHYDKIFEKLEGSLFPGTFDWILRNTTFSEVVDETTLESCMLWISGHPGAGKTHLCKAILDALLHSATTAGLHSQTIAYAFASYGDEDSASAVSIYRSLIWQIVENSEIAVDVALKRFNDTPRRNMRNARWMVELLRTLLLQAESPPCFLVVDGLDECEKRERAEICKEFLGFTSDPRLAHVKIIVSSRSEYDLERILKGRCKRLPLHEMNCKDIERFVRGTLEGSALWNNALEEASEVDRLNLMIVPEEIVKASGGIFLYARLVTNLILQSGSIIGIFNATVSLPANIDEIYSRVMEEIRSSDLSRQTYAKRIFSWMICAKRRLTITEIKQAIIIEDAGKAFSSEKMILRESIKEYCGCFVEEDAGSVTFIHFSAKEYLTREDKHDGKAFVSIPAAQLSVTEACLNYLCMDHCNNSILQEGDALKGFIISNSYVMLDYAAAYWIIHVVDCLHISKKTCPVVGDVLSRAVVIFELHARREPSTCIPSAMDTDFAIPSEISSLGIVKPELSLNLREYFSFFWRSRVVVTSLAFYDCDPTTLWDLSMKVESAIAELQPVGLRTNRQEYRFRCPFIRCNSHFHGFLTFSEKHHHLWQHFERIRHAEESPNGSDFISSALAATSGFESGLVGGEAIGAQPHCGSSQTLSVKQLQTSIVLRLLLSSLRKKDLKMAETLLHTIWSRNVQLDAKQMDELLRLSAAQGYVETCVNILDGSRWLYSPAGKISTEILRCLMTQIGTEDPNQTFYGLIKTLLKNGADSIRRSSKTSRFRVQVNEGIYCSSPILIALSRGQMGLLQMFMGDYDLSLGIVSYRSKLHSEWRKQVYETDAVGIYTGKKFRAHSNAHAKNGIFGFAAALCSSDIFAKVVHYVLNTPSANPKFSITIATGSSLDLSDALLSACACFNYEVLEYLMDHDEGAIGYLHYGSSFKNCLRAVLRSDFAVERKKFPTLLVLIRRLGDFELIDVEGWRDLFSLAVVLDSGKAYFRDQPEFQQIIEKHGDQDNAIFSVTALYKIFDLATDLDFPPSTIQPLFNCLTVNESLKKELIMRCRGKTAEIPRILAEGGVDASTINGLTADFISIAIKSRDIRTIYALLEVKTNLYPSVPQMNVSDGESLRCTATVDSWDADISRRLAEKGVGAKVSLEDFCDKSSCKALDGSDARHERVIDFLLSIGADPNPNRRRERDLLTTLSYNQSLSELLIELGADVGAVTYESGLGTPLQIAASNKHEGILKLLIQKGADVNFTERSSHGTPLYIAVTISALKNVRILIDSGADVNAPCRPGRSDTPLFAALQQGNEDITKALVNHGAEMLKWPSLKITSSFRSALLHGEEKLVDAMVADGAGLTAVGDVESALKVAAGYGCLPIFKCLLKHGALDHITEEFVWGLVSRRAPKNKRLDIIRLLLERELPRLWRSGCSIPTYFEKLVNRGIENADEVIIKSAIERGADMDADTVEKLFECGAYSNAGMGDLEELLRLGTEKSDMRIVSLVIDKGLDVNFEGPHGTPLQVAARRSNAEVVLFLLDKGAEVNTTAGSHGTPLQLAAAYSTHPEVVRTLIEKGADINTSTKFGNPLFGAIREQRRENVRVLLENRVSPNSICLSSTPKYRSKSVLEFARLYPDSWIVDILVQYGATETGSCWPDRSRPLESR